MSTVKIHVPVRLVDGVVGPAGGSSSPHAAEMAARARIGMVTRRKNTRHMEILLAEVADSEKEEAPENLAYRVS
jgi:hypothetical protein